MGWEAIIDMHTQFNQTTLLGKRIENDNWEFKWNYGHLNLENNIDITLVKPINDIEITVSPYSKVVSSLDEALALYDWKALFPKVIHPQFRDSIWQRIHMSSISNEKKLKWFMSCYPSKQNILKVASQLLESKYSVTMIGQTPESHENISDKKGIWKYVDVPNIFSIGTFEYDYDIFRKYVSYKLKIIEDSKIPDYFNSIAKLESNNFMNSVIFQNYTTSGIKRQFTNVIDLQGQLDSIVCHNCREQNTKREFIHNKPCPSCGGKLRPHMTLAGEKFQKKNWNKVVKEIEQAELIFCIDCDISVPYFSKLLGRTNVYLIIISTKKQSIEIKKNNSFYHFIDTDPNKFFTEIETLFSL